jgi:hypothetical protein
VKSSLSASLLHSPIGFAVSVSLDLLQDNELYPAIVPSALKIAIYSGNAG